MLGSSGKCLNNSCIIYSRYLASSTGNEFSIWKCVTECHRQEVSLRSWSWEAGPGSLNTHSPFLHRIPTPTGAVIWTLLRSLITSTSTGPDYISSSSFISKSDFSYPRNRFSNAIYSCCALQFLKCLGRWYLVNLVECYLPVFFVSIRLLSPRTELSFPTVGPKASLPSLHAKENFVPPPGPLVLLFKSGKWVRGIVRGAKAILIYLQLKSREIPRGKAKGRRGKWQRETEAEEKQNQRETELFWWVARESLYFVQSGALGQVDGMSKKNRKQFLMNGCFHPFGILGEAAVKIYIGLQISFRDGWAFLLRTTPTSKLAWP